ncbi:helix-turn-helix transcriptional regulator [Aliidiomarina soli]|uniref:AraC family transcriptional regulator n=1 Tax=Aliidiomarina soli TaxID=1928574 RepID=A0A432WLK5_9GAMM|nr:AraC family transcriptional regulator [Aliidiomarina soli]RUO34638.1 AraC family transcriptional regulator [Aliidiomarina soli]
MSQPSRWPLPAGSSRLLLPQTTIDRLHAHPFSRQLYPIAYGHYLHAVGHRVRRSVHTDHLLIFCHQGSGRYQTEHQSGTLEAGQVLFLKRGQAHSYQADQHTPWSIYWAHFAGEQVEQYMDFVGVNRDDQPPVITLSNWRALLPDVTQLLNLQHQRLNLERALLAAKLLQKLIVQLPSLRRLEQPQGANFTITTLERFMHDNSHRALELKDFANFSGLSTFHFSKKFRQLTGTSPLRYFNQLKVREAQRMLLDSNHSIRQIGQTLGFDDAYYFSRLFKKMTGVSPLAYRRQHTHQPADSGE